MPRPPASALALILLTLLVYAPVRQFEFVNWDDTTYITQNPHVGQGLTWQSVTWALTTGYTPYWHPVTWLSHLLDVEWYGQRAGLHHLTSLVIHVANSLLVFALFRRMTQDLWRSAFVAAVFAVHPLHVESVAWISERKDVLSTFFWGATLWAYLSYVKHPAVRRYLLVTVCFAIALMAKPMVVTLPLVLMLLDVWPIGRGMVIRDKVPLFALAAASSIATFLVQSRVRAVAGLDALPWSLRLENAAIGYVAYIAKTVWPVRLAAFYPYHAHRGWQVAAAASTLALATAAVVRYRRAHPYAFVGWLWFLLTVLPVIGILQAGQQAMADRFMYVPMIGLLIIVAWGIPRFVSPAAPAALPVPAAAVVVVLLCAATARAQVSYWRNSVTLWEHAIAVTSGNYVAFENLGEALRDRGRLDEARASYRSALRYAPSGSPIYAAMIHNGLGLVATRQGNSVEALEDFAAAVRLNPRFPEAQGNLGNALATQRRFSEAVEHYEAALRLKPDFLEAHVGLGASLLGAGRAAGAIPHYREAVRIAPDLPQLHNGLGAALAAQGRDEEAMAEYGEALRLKADLATAHVNLALVLLKHGRTDEARRHLQQALASDPGYEPARRLLARIGA